MRDWTKGDCIQLCIAIIIMLNLIVFWVQYNSTQLLNKPLCAVKQLVVEPALQGKNVTNAEKVDPSVKDKNIIKISAVIKNFGKYKAEKASITWKMVAFEKSEKSGYVAKEVIKESAVSTDITILPEQEFEQWLWFVNKKNLDNIVEGYKKAVDISINIKFLTEDGKKEEMYSCTYRVTKMLITNEYLYEVSLVNSSIKS